jgi:TRAP-type C4-dicarboxylate transport system substrate-binding protein
MKHLFTPAALAVALLTGGAQAETVWRLSNWVPPNHPVVVDIFQVWAQKVGAATEGRVKVQIIPALGAPPAHFDLVRNGVADVALIGPSYTPARFSLVKIAELPFISDTSTASSMAIARVQERHFAKAKEFAGVKLAGIWTHGPAHVFTIRKPVLAIADFRGLKIRTAGGISDQVAGLAGATPFFAPVNQTYDVLSKGVADGILFPAEGIPSFRLDTIVRHGTLIDGGIYQITHAFIINPAKWDALSAADQAAVDRLNGEALTRMASAVWDRINGAGIETMKKAGIQIHRAPPELMADLRQRYAQLLDDWKKEAAKKGVDAEAAWKLVQDTVKEFGAK